MKYFIYMLFASLLINYAIATTQLKPRIVLLTSLDMSKSGDYYKNYLDNIEFIFKKKISDILQWKEDEYILNIVHYATATDIRRALMSPDSVAVIYLSHAGYSSQGMLESSIISDFELNDVKEAFYDVHPNLKFLGVIGCTSKEVFARLKNSGYSLNSDLEIMVEATIVDAQKSALHALGQAVKKLNNFSGTNYDCTRTVKKTFAVDVKRTIPSDITKEEVKNLFLQVKGKLIGVMPKIGPNESQSIRAYIDAEDISAKGDLKITVLTGARIAGETPEETTEIASINKTIEENKAVMKKFDKLDEEDRKVYTEKASKSIAELETFRASRREFYKSKASKIYIGNLDITPSWNKMGKYKVLTIGGKASGINSNTYLYNGDLPDKKLAINFNPYSCGEIKKPSSKTKWFSDLFSNRDE